MKTEKSTITDGPAPTKKTTTTAAPTNKPEEIPSSEADNTIEPSVTKTDKDVKESKENPWCQFEEWRPYHQRKEKGKGYIKDKCGKNKCLQKDNENH